MKILLSPVSITDPVSYDFDGPMIHICRHFLPDKIYLFLSKKMIEYHKKDDRYRKTIRLLEENLKEKGIIHHFDINLILEKDFVNVQDFDEAYKRLYNAVRKIEQEASECDEIIFNASSGTAEMQASLMIIASRSDRYGSYIVSTPTKRLNTAETKHDKYDAEFLWNNNFDAQSSETTECRMSEAPYFSLVTDIDMEAFKRHIARYDYDAAMAIASKDARLSKCKNLMALLNTARFRIARNIEQADKSIKSYDPKSNLLKTIGDRNDRLAAEYILWLDIKNKKKDYSDFIKGVTPAISAILRKFIFKAGIRIPDSSDLRWQDFILEKTIKNGKSVRDIVSSITGARVKNKQLGDLAKEILNDKQIGGCIDKACDFELKMRNKCSHEITEISMERIIEETSISPDDMMDILKRLALSSFGMRKELFNQYDIMNKTIIEEAEAAIS